MGGAVILALMALVGSAHGKIAQTTYGPVEGYTDINVPVDVWKGIPYADPPTGINRWKAPMSHKKWEIPRLCVVDAPACPQPVVYIAGQPEFEGKEDCLTLDVYSPSDSLQGNGKLPVMFFIHGGAFRTGNANGDGEGVFKDLYDGSQLAAQNNAVVVSVNYRMGIFGFLALEQLRKERSDRGTGNYGLMDQRFAMQWVQNNIAQFGGDPSKVMIFGQSAGGSSVCAQYTSKASEGLFSSAVLESPLCAGKAPFIPLDVGLNWGKMMIERAGCKGAGDELQCMRSAKAKDLLLPQAIEPGVHGLPANPNSSIPLPGLLKGNMWFPTVDGSESGLLDYPINLVQKGIFNDVPVIVGTNHNEGTAFLSGIVEWAGQTMPVGSEEEAKRVLKHYLPQLNTTGIEDVANLYRSTGPNWNTSLAFWIRDYFLSCPDRKFMQALRSAREKKGSDNLDAMWMYMFNRTFDSPYWHTIGDTHGIELFWVFDKPIQFGVIGKWDQADHQLSAVMGTYWSAMARSGDPNKHPSCTGCINWPAYTSTGPGVSGDYLVFQERPGMGTTTDLYSKFCDFWDRTGYEYPKFV